MDSLLILPRISTEICKSFSFADSKIWSSLPLSVKSPVHFQIYWKYISFCCFFSVVCHAVPCCDWFLCHWLAFSWWIWVSVINKFVYFEVMLSKCIVIYSNDIVIMKGKCQSMEIYHHVWKAAKSRWDNPIIISLRNNTP